MQRLTSVLAGTALACAFFATSALPSQAEKVLQGEICSERVHELTSNVEWYKNLHKAEDAAREQGKLVFWLHMVGKIDGAT